MNAQIAKKIRKYSKRNWIEYLKEIRKWPFSVRWRYAWWVLFGK